MNFKDKRRKYLFNGVKRTYSEITDLLKCMTGYDLYNYFERYMSFHFKYNEDYGYPDAKEIINAMYFEKKGEYQNQLNIEYIETIYALLIAMDADYFKDVICKSVMEEHESEKFKYIFLDDQFYNNSRIYKLFGNYDNTTIRNQQVLNKVGYEKHSIQNSLKKEDDSIIEIKKRRRM